MYFINFLLIFFSYKFLRFANFFGFLFHNFSVISFFGTFCRGGRRRRFRSSGSTRFRLYLCCSFNKFIFRNFFRCSWRRFYRIRFFVSGWRLLDFLFSLFLRSSLKFFLLFFFLHSLTLFNPILLYSLYFSFYISLWFFF
uniref:Uncharacterized protein n=1 Tax=Panstrongylus lignarius TaxID=156445 RepID=A0A224XNH9_9HEMI